MSHKESFLHRYIKLLAAIGIGIIIALLPVPEGVDPKGWYLFSIFVSTITAIVLKPFPMGAVAFMGVLACALTNIIPLESAMSGFSKNVIWLVIFVFCIARGFIKTQLGTRVAYWFVRALGKSTLGLGYGLTLTEVLIAPFIPSNSARTGGIMLPILKSVSEALGSTPKNHTEKKLGSYLTQVCFQANVISSAMFLTGMAANPLAQAMALKQNVVITWMSWFKAALVPGIISIIAIPLILYYTYPPRIKVLPEAQNIAKQKLEEMGPMSKKEWLMTGIFGVMLVLWMIGDDYGINAATTALLGLVLLLLTNIIDWRDVLLEHEAWHTLIWLSILVTLSMYLEKYGLIGWFSNQMGLFVNGWSWEAAFLMLSLIYFYSHYLFASNTAHVSSMYAAFLAVSIAAGTPPTLAALVLAFYSSLFSSMTHYGTSSAAVLFGAGFVTLPAWWLHGLIISIANIIIWLVFGGIWWKVLGIW